MSKEKWKGGALLAPVPPALVSCGSIEKPNVLTVAWTGILNTHPPKTYISVRPSRHSYGLIKESGEFVINLTTAPLTRAADFCGVRSGRDTDKFAQCSLTPEPSTEVSAPSIAESPVSLECRVTDIIPLGTHDMFMADILAVTVDNSLISADGKLHLEKSGLVAYAHGEYFELGRKLGFFGFSVQKKKKRHTARNTQKK
ncbi:MAG: flavin reductase family protein [Clostridia bacterium]|nr:flavin reductase family protein [Clostridia bacterium]